MKLGPGRFASRKPTASLLAATVCFLGVSWLGCHSGRETASAGDAKPGQTQGPAVTVRRDNPCSVLLPQEVEKIIGMPIAMREVVDEQTCSFPFDKAAKAGALSPRAPESKHNAGSPEQDAEAMAKSMASGMAEGEPRLVVKVYWENGRQAIAAIRMAGQLLGGNDAGFEKLSGIGDEAWLGPMASDLTFVKGQTGVAIDLRMVPNGREPGIRLAKLIASRL